MAARGGRVLLGEVPGQRLVRNVQGQAIAVAAQGRGVIAAAPGGVILAAPGRRVVVAAPGPAAPGPAARGLVPHAAGLQNEDPDDPDPVVPARDRNADRRTSATWHFFERQDNPNQALCTLCLRLYSTGGGTSNMKEHLERKHSAEYLEYKTQQGLDNEVRGRYGYHSVEKKKLDRLLVRFVAKNMQQLSLVENDAFKEFVNALNPKYGLPCRKTLTNADLPELYDEVKAKIKLQIDAVKKLAITTDGWSSNTQEHFLGVTAHYILNKTESAVLDVAVLPGSHTAEVIARRLSEVFDEWNLNGKIVGIVTDNANNMKAAVRLVNLPQLSCVAHTLNLCVQEAIGSSFAVRTLFDRGCEIVTFFKQSTVAAEKLKNLQIANRKPRLRLIQAVVHRWNSKLHMGRRLVEVRPELVLAQSELTNAPRAFDGEDWKVLLEALEILKELERLTVTLSGEKYVTVSKIIPLVHGLILQFEKVQTKIETDEAKDLLQNILDQVITRLLPYESSALPRGATLLDPRFKKAAFRSDSRAEDARKMVEDAVGLLCGRSVPEPQLQIETPAQELQWAGDSLLSFMVERVADSTHHTTARSSAIVLLRRYMETPPESRKDPIVYWLTESEKNALQEVALGYLCVPATSVPSERVFSLAGQVLTDRRNSLSPQNAKMLVFLGGNEHHF